MPVVEIFVRRGRTPEQIRALTDAVHDALVEAYEVPREDRFQIVNQREPHEFVFDPHFMGGPRTDDFVLVRVTAGKPRSVQAKRRFFELTARHLAERTGISAADVFVVVDNVTLGDLSLSHGRPFDVVLGEQ
ncbi:tautomerase family protein [Mycolicibacterium sp.]|uniref:tautomerase family protein n=1 Tax=Mycolicibacterium sp. TaxID=2320850 RepID=UPI003D0B9A0F